MTLFALLFALAQDGAAGDWPTFLGPDHTGNSRETGLLKAWPPDGPPVLWKAELGETYAAPSVVKDALLLFHRLKDEEVVERRDPATGKPAWRFAYPTAYSDRFGYNNGPRSAPTIDAGRVHVLGAEGRYHCLDLAAGKVVWTRDLHDDYFKDARQNFFGCGVAPRIDGDRVLLNLGDDRAGCVTALDKSTGKTLWRATDDGASYSTAVAADFDGVRQAVFLTRDAAIGVAAADGALLWRYPFRSRDRFSANAATPIVIGKQLFITATYGLGGALLEPGATGVKEVWRNPAMGAHWATPIHVDGHLYGFDGRHDHEATLRCVRLSDGAMAWEKPGYGRGSLLLVEGKFILLSEDGRLVLADLTPKGATELASARLLKPHCWTSPVLSRGLLYVQDFDHRTGKGTLFCLDLRAR